MSGYFFDRLLTKKEMLIAETNSVKQNIFHIRSTIEVLEEKINEGLSEQEKMSLFSEISQGRAILDRENRYLKKLINVLKKEEK